MEDVHLPTFQAVKYLEQGDHTPKEMALFLGWHKARVSRFLHNAYLLGKVFVKGYQKSTGKYREVARFAWRQGQEQDAPLPQGRELILPSFSAPPKEVNEYLAAVALLQDGNQNVPSLMEKLGWGISAAANFLERAHNEGAAYISSYSSTGRPGALLVPHYRWTKGPFFSERDCPSPLDIAVRRDRRRHGEKKDPNKSYLAIACYLAARPEDTLKDVSEALQVSADCVRVGLLKARKGDIPGAEVLASQLQEKRKWEKGALTSVPEATRNILRSRPNSVFDLGRLAA